MWLSDLARSLPGLITSIGEDVVIGGICADSRRVQPGDLFVAVAGVRLDGHAFICQAVAKGAVAVIGELPFTSPKLEAGREFTYVRVQDSRTGWAWASAAWAGFPSRQLILIGVTGTDGKTTTVSLIHAMLAAAGHRAGLISTIGALVPSNERGSGGFEELDTGLHTTTPDPPQIQETLSQMVERGATHAVLEATSHGLAQHRVGGCDFDVAAVTNVTHEHLDYHGSLDAYRRAKGLLFEGLKHSYRKEGVPKVSVLNRDDGSYKYLRSFEADRQVSYSIERSADVVAEDVQFARDRTQFTLRTERGRIRIETRLVGGYNVANVLAAAAVGEGLGISLKAIAQGAAWVRAVPGRMERIDEGQPYTAIVDFAHTPNALQHAVIAARRMVKRSGRVIAVFGSAGLRDREKRRLMGQVGGRLADVVIVTAEDPRTESLDAILRESAEAAENEGKRRGADLFVIADRGEALLKACEMARTGDVVIACGKGHEQSMCFGSTEYPWDDREAMRLALRGRALDTLPTARRDDGLREGSKGT